MTNDELLKEYIRHLHIERGLSPRTLESYSYQIKGYLEFLESQQLTLSNVTHEFVVTYFEKLKGRGLKGASIFAAAITIRGFHRFLLERKYVTSDPTIGMRLPKFTQRLPDTLSIAEMEKLLNMPTGTKFHRIRFRAMMELLYATGLRVSELIGLKMDHINLEEGWVRVMGKGNKERIVPFGLRAKESLLSYIDVRGNRIPLAKDTLFLNSRGYGLTRGGFWWELKQSFTRAGLNVHASPHSIRHSAASHMLASGADIRIIQELLGHSSILTTQRYTHINPELLRATCRKSHPRF